MARFYKGKEFNIEYCAYPSRLRRCFCFWPYGTGDTVKVKLELKLNEGSEWTHVAIIIKPKTMIEEFNTSEDEPREIETRYLAEVVPIHHFVGSPYKITFPLRELKNHDLRIKLRKFEGKQLIAETQEIPIALFQVVDGQALQQNIIFALVNALFAVLASVLAAYVAYLLATRN